MTCMLFSSRCQRRQRRRAESTQPLRIRCCTPNSVPHGDMVLERTGGTWMIEVVVYDLRFRCIAREPGQLPFQKILCRSPRSVLQTGTYVITASSSEVGAYMFLPCPLFCNLAGSVSFVRFHKERRKYPTEHRTSNSL